MNERKQGQYKTGNVVNKGQKLREMNKHKGNQG